jgi:hypothetical protein
VLWSFRESLTEIYIHGLIELINFGDFKAQEEPAIEDRGFQRRQPRPLRWPSTAMMPSISWSV